MPLMERKGAITVLHPSGPLRAENVASYDEQLRPMLSGGLPYVVIDLSDTPLIDGDGLEWILALDEACCQRGGCVKICSACELCRDVLRITSVGASVQQFEELTLALGSFA